MPERKESNDPVQGKYQQENKEQVNDPEDRLWYFIFYQH
jgi:hypothetical protein